MEMKSVEEQELRQKAIDLCGKALRGSLSLTGLQQLWPLEASKDSFLAQVYRDLEDGVEHLPGFAFRSGVNREAWLSSEMYWLIYLDVALLSQHAPTTQMLRCRHAIATQQLRDEATVNVAVAKCLGC